MLVGHAAHVTAYQALPVYVCNMQESLQKHFKDAHTLNDVLLFLFHKSNFQIRNFLLMALGQTAAVFYSSF